MAVANSIAGGGEKYVSLVATVIRHSASEWVCGWWWGVGGRERCDYRHGKTERKGREKEGER